MFAWQIRKVLSGPGNSIFNEVIGRFTNRERPLEVAGGEACPSKVVRSLSVPDVR